LRRSYKVALQLGVSAALVGILLWQIDVVRTAELVVSSSPGYLLGALAIHVATTWLLAWRWQILLASKGIHEPLGWLTKLYFVGYAAGQVLPTSIGGDALRIVEHVGDPQRAARLPGRCSWSACSAPPARSCS
jgi:glycosyltransferase 2 family protein